MAAKPRLTVRLSPSYLHALAYIAERDGSAPAEVAREMMGAQISAKLQSSGWRRDWESTYRAWLAEQGAKPGRAESPEQRDYDALADGQMSASSPALRRAEEQIAAQRGILDAAEKAGPAGPITRRQLRDLGS